MSLRAKFSLLIVFIFGFLTVAMSLLQAHWVRTVVFAQTEARMAQSIHAAWNVLESRRRLLEAHASSLAELGELEEYREAETERLTTFLRLYRERWNLDFIALVDDAGRVVVETGSLRRGAVLPVSKGMAAESGIVVASPELFDEDAEELLERLVAGGERRDAMVLFAQHPLENEPTSEASHLVAGVVLNGAHQFVDAIQTTIFPSEFYQGKRVGTATVFLGPVRVATTVLLDSGSRAVGTVVSDEVAEQVLEHGEPWTGPALVVDNWYVSRYDPIRNPEGDVVGMLYIGELKQIYDDIESRTLLTSLSVLLAIMAGALVLSFVLVTGILRQITALEQATKAFSRGDYSARANIRTGGEIGELAHSFNRMAEIIEEDRTQIMRQKDEIERANRGYMGMLSFATHEFRNSIGAALLNLQLLKEGAFGKVEGEVLEGVDIVEKSLRYMSDISDNFLQLSRIERGELSVTKSRVKLREAIVEPVLEDKTGLLDTRNMSLEIAIPDEFSVIADPNLLRVVIENLVSNAIKYGKDDGRIVIAGCAWNGGAEISVWNEGPAIPPEQLETLFEKFRRFDAGTVSSRRGAGLGLFLVKHIVDQHEGEVAVESAEGEGTRFIIRLPGNEHHSATRNKADHGVHGSH
ncbi:MAG: cache domain-containing protein [Candidatus Hydrogenedentota bacterium]